MNILSENDRGWVALDGNELIVGSKVDDPPKLRLTQPLTKNGGGGGAISYCFHKIFGRAVSGTETVEMGMLRMEQASDVRGQDTNPKAEMNFLLNDGSGAGDSAMRKPLAFIFNAVTAALIQILSARTDTIWAPDGLTFTQQQSDGNFVSYKVDRPFDKAANAQALWSAWTGKIG